MVNEHTCKYERSLGYTMKRLVNIILTECNKFPLLRSLMKYCTFITA